VVLTSPRAGADGGRADEEVGVDEPGGRSHGGDEIIARAAEFDAPVSVGVVTTLLAGSWVGTYALGGSQSVGPQLFHVPVILAAVRFGHVGGLISAVVAGLLCGPFMPLDVDAGTEQSFGNWFARLALFVLVGQVVAAFQSRSLVTARRRLSDQAVRRAHAEALAEGRFRPVFQPIVELSTGRIVGVEALARLEMAHGVEALPAAFIPDAERTGTIVDIDDAIMRAACRQLGEWVDEGRVDDDFHVAVNLSARDLDDPSLVERVAAHLDDARLEPRRLVLELTETSLASDSDAAAKKLAALRELGVGIALDDFGVGQSSLGSLGQFPIDRFKIDRSFTVEITTGPREATFVGSVIRLAEALALDDPVIEGIETTEQVDALMAAGARWGQGYLFGRPVSAARMLELIAIGRVEPIAE
jgi:diguanylate cyclase